MKVLFYDLDFNKLLAIIENLPYSELVKAVEKTDGVLVEDILNIVEDYNNEPDND